MIKPAGIRLTRCLFTAILHGIATWMALAPAHATTEEVPGSHWQIDLASWNKTPWNYPSIPEIQASVPARSIVKVSTPSIHWALGKESYWWPNKPFREDYTPQLHQLELSLAENGKPLQTVTRRFGFVEWSEGPYYYRVNGVRINFISDAAPEATENRQLYLILEWLKGGETVFHDESVRFLIKTTQP